MKVTLNRSLIRKPGAVTGEPKAKMFYKSFFRDITLKYNVVLRKWPQKELKAPGSMGNSLPAVTKLLDLVNDGEIFFELVDEEELQQLTEEENRKISSGEVEVATRRIRKDAGLKRSLDSEDVDDTDESGSDSGDGPGAAGGKKARKLTTKRTKTAHKSASVVVDSD